MAPFLLLVSNKFISDTAWMLWHKGQKYYSAQI
jgi:hypothetical protein